MRNRQIGLALALSAILALGSGCSHALVVKNLRSYTNTQMNPLGKPVTVGVVPSTEDMDSQRLMKGIGDGLSKYSATVLLPYYPTGAKKADVVANIRIRPEYKGSGWNFLINFPGFLIWTPAWHGYNYRVNYDIEVLLSRGADNTKIDSWTIPVKLNLRHAEMDRTWTEVSWFEVGIIALVGGIVFIGYDDDVTPILVDKIEVPIGDYVAQEIITRINNAGGFGYMRRARDSIASAAHPAN